MLSLQGPHVLLIAFCSYLGEIILHEIRKKKKNGIIWPQNKLRSFIMNRLSERAFFREPTRRPGREFKSLRMEMKTTSEYLGF